MGMIEVNSAFGGLGIYKKEVFICGKYEGLDSKGYEVSDHISFHSAIRKAGYRIFIDCGLVNSNYHLDNTSDITNLENKWIFSNDKIFVKTSENLFDSSAITGYETGI